MEKDMSDKMIAEAAKVLFLYCHARTNSKEEAEDLSQDILLELLQSSNNLRSDKAFYGFMWAVARNVYKNWCKKRVNLHVPLGEHISDEVIHFDELLEKKADLHLLYRELSMLTEQHRKATVLYYFDNLKVSEISKSLCLSKSMVKFLLFKARQILKEGMSMERTRGDLSFNPSTLSLVHWHWNDPIGFPFSSLTNDNLIAQNILLACYNDRCTAEEISIQLGVAVPYLEKDLKALCEKDVLVRKGGRYETAVVIFTKDFSVEAENKTRTLQNELATIITRFLEKHLADVKAIGLNPRSTNDNFLRWHLTVRIIKAAILEKYTESLNLECPTKYAGCRAWVWGAEGLNSVDDADFLVSGYANANGDNIDFTNYRMNGKMDMFLLWDKNSRKNLLIDIAKGKCDGFSENDKFEIAELIRLGFVKNTDGTLSAAVSVYTKEQFNGLRALIDGVTDDVMEKTREIINICTNVLLQHTPASMKKEAEYMGWLNLWALAVSPTIKNMVGNGTLYNLSDSEHPTTCILLK